MALEDLDKIDWAQYNHAYGPATDVPDLLRALRSSDEEIYGQAVHELFGNIWHQGTVYEATAYAVPYLIELLAVPAVACKADILFLLEAVARGSSYHDVHQHLSHHYHERQTEDFQATVRKELAWVAAAHEAVEQGVETYLALLGDKDAKVAALAPFTLAACYQNAETILPILRVKIEKETRMPVKVSLVRGAATLLDDAGKAQETLSESYLTLFTELASNWDEPPYVRLAAAISLVYLGGSAYVDLALLLFAQVGSACNEQIASYFPWSIGYEGSVKAMSKALSAYPQIHVHWLVGLLSHPDFSGTEVCSAILEEIQEACRTSRSAARVAAPHLVQLLTDEDEEVRKTVARALPAMGQAKWLAGEKLRSLQTYPNDAARELAIQILERFQEVEQEVAEMVESVMNPKIRCDLGLPELVGQIRDNVDSRSWVGRDERRKALRCVDQIGVGGMDAADLAFFRQLLDHGDAETRVYAARILWAATGDAEMVLPVLIDALSCSPVEFLALKTIEELGPAAGPAVPELRRIAHSDRRAGIWVTYEAWNEVDDVFAAKVREVWQRIDEVLA